MFCIVYELWLPEGTYALKFVGLIKIIQFKHGILLIPSIRFNLIHRMKNTNIKVPIRKVINQFHSATFFYLFLFPAEPTINPLVLSSIYFHLSAYSFSLLSPNSQFNSHTASSYASPAAICPDPYSCFNFYHFILQSGECRSFWFIFGKWSRSD